MTMLCTELLSILQGADSYRASWKSYAAGDSAASSCPADAAWMKPAFA